MVRQMNKCLICEQRPARKAGFCAQCYGHIEHERQARAPIEPRYFIAYRGYVVGLYPNGKSGVLKAQLSRRDASKLPKRKTINLDVYCDGYTREQVKEFKACVLKLAQA